MVAYAIGNRNDIKFVKDFLGNRSIESFYRSLKQESLRSYNTVHPSEYKSLSQNWLENYVIKRVKLTA